MFITIVNIVAPCSRFEIFFWFSLASSVASLAESNCLLSTVQQRHHLKHPDIQPELKQQKAKQK
jgi:hypothetical protein